MNWFRRLFGGVASVAAHAEAAGQLEHAAALYARAGDAAGFVRVQLRRATELSGALQGEVLREAYHGASANQAARRDAARALGQHLWLAASARGLGLPEELTQASEAAQLLRESGDAAAAAEIYTRMGQHELAAQAYVEAGMVEATVAALNSHDAQPGADNHAARNAIEDARAYFAAGQRDRALEAWDAAVQHGAGPVASAAALDLRSRLLSNARITFVRERQRLTCIGGRSAVIGRHPTVAWQLATPAISREHARVELGPPPRIVDLGGVNRVRVGGLSVDGALHLTASEGTFELGTETEVRFSWSDETLRLTIARGRDAGAELRLAPARMRLADDGLAASLEFRDGRPWLVPDDAIEWNGERCVVPVQLISGDSLRINSGLAVVQ